MIFPLNNQTAEQDLQVSALYRKSHAAYEPGEQRSRNYEWRSLEPADHRFGYMEKKVAGGAALALTSERPVEAYPKTVIVKKTVEDHKAVASDMLGKSKNLGNG